MDSTYYNWCYSPRLPRSHRPEMDLKWSFTWEIVWLKLRLGAFCVRVNDC